MKKALLLFVIVVGLVGFVFGSVMTVMAVCFHEWGRVVFYAMVAILALEASVVCVLKLKKKS